MYRRNRDNNRRHYRRHNTERRPRSVMMRPSVQITIVIVAVLVIYIILQSGGK